MACFLGRSGIAFMRYYGLQTALHKERVRQVGYCPSEGRDQVVRRPADTLDLLERETGLEPPTLCLGIRSGHDSLPSARVRRHIFMGLSAIRRSRAIRSCPSPSIRLATVWLQSSVRLSRSQSPIT